ncbi:hypothetical protein BGZ65_006142 [Modicella reniformis]|uniref:Uncharacterized protein n=1 Tax=Modicella reniformis TaxID=1440133 RepID=A0A9P6IYD9_9FUNG|nr:hypothetical protein BGZ65_006142 [Modicella reniformis]
MDMFKAMAMAKLKEQMGGGGGGGGDDNDSDDDDVKEQKAEVIAKVASEDHPPAGESDVQEAKAAHDKVYNSSEEASADEVGKAAGAQAFKAFEVEGGIGGKNALVEKAMAEATTLLADGKGGGDKSAVLMSAVTMASKLLVSNPSLKSAWLGLVSKAGVGGDDSDKEDDNEDDNDPLVGFMSKPAEAGAKQPNPVAVLLAKFL